MRTTAQIAMLLLCSQSIASADETLVFEGEVPLDSSDFFFVPFQVPARTAEIEVQHDDLSEDNILDWGLSEPSGRFRGWGGGNTEPAIVGVDRASRSYLTGPIPEGTWNVQIGKAQIVDRPARYHVEITLRDEPTLRAQPRRSPYHPAAAIESGARWYAGDFHVHSLESGDAVASFDQIGQLAQARGLDFVEVSDHNTSSHLDYLVDAQSRWPAVLFMPGVEFTTYDGHANGIGATEWVDHKIGLPGVGIDQAADRFADQGALFSINHPTLDLFDYCIGCAWRHELPETLAAIEITTGGYRQSGYMLEPSAVELWDELCSQGRHLAALGGSDDHRAGVDLGPFQSPLGDPTTMVFAEALSVEAILEAIRSGRTVVKLQGPDDPMVELTSSVPPTGDTVFAKALLLGATVTGGRGARLRFVKNGEVGERFEIDRDPFTAELEVGAPVEGEDRWRAEVYRESVTTVTSHLYVRMPDVRPADAQGSGCASGGPGAQASLAMSLWLLLWALWRKGRSARRPYTSPTSA